LARRKTSNTNQVDESEDEKRFGYHQLFPIVRTRHPELAISDQRLTVHDADDQEHPGERHQNDHQLQQDPVDEESREADCHRVLVRPAVNFDPGKRDHQSHRSGNFKPMVTDVFCDDVQNLFHRCSLFMRLYRISPSLGRSTATTSA
jgi:hypothetical protein